MVLITLSSHFNSFFAKAYKVNDIKSLRLYFQKSRLLYVLYNIPFFIIFIFFEKSIIALFGQVPESVYDHLILLFWSVVKFNFWIIRAIFVHGK